MTHRYLHFTLAAFLLTVAFGFTILNAQVTYASAPFSTVEFTMSFAISTITYGARDVAVGDFNSDGKMDAVIIDPGFGGSPYVSIVLGDGNGHLGYSHRFLPGIIPWGIAVGDFNSDGKLDVATSSYYGSSVAIIYGDGAGSFSGVSFFETGIENPSIVGGATDLNNDGRTDLIIVHTDNNTFQILFNRSNGRMVLSAPYPVGTSPRDVVTADFNGDGKTDIATANHDSGNVSVLLATDGTGNFSTAMTYNVGQLPYSLVAADFNNDGKSDLALAGDDHVSILQNNGVGFNAPVDFSAEASDLSTSIATGDFNGDNKIDIVTGKWAESGSGSSVLLGTGTGDFQSPLSLRLGVATVAAADFNGDGRTDILTHDQYILKLHSSRVSTPSHKIDYDGDNKTDFAIWRPSEGNWYILNSGFNTLRVEHWGMESLGDIPVPGDYDGDLQADLAVYRSSTGTWYIQRSSDSSIQAQQFGIPGDKPVQGDFDGDLKTDIAVWRPAEGTWYILQSSDGAFRAQQWGRGDLGDQPVQGDYDLDGKTDLAVVRTAEHRWFIDNSSSDAVTDVTWGTTGDVPFVFTMGGKAEIAMWRPSNNVVYAYRSGFIGMQGNGNVPVPGDYDGDGLIDYAMLNSSTGNWFIYRTGNTPISYHFGSAGDIPVSVPYLLEQ